MGLKDIGPIHGILSIEKNLGFVLRLLISFLQPETFGERTMFHHSAVIDD